MSHVNLQLEQYTHILLHGHIAGSPPQGRPRNKWIDNIKEECSFLGITPIDATRSVHTVKIRLQKGVGKTYLG